MGRKDFIATIYPVSPFGTQIREVLTINYQTANITHRSFGIFRELLQPGGQENDPLAQLELDEVMHRVKESGYRTIVLALEDPFLELPVIAQSANRVGLTNGDFLWVHFGEFEFSFVYGEDPDVIRFLSGSVLSLPLDDETDQLISAWNKIDSDFTARVRASYPKDALGGYVLTTEYYEAFAPDYFSGFAYDAILTAAIGTCEAWRVNQSTLDIPIETHLDGIQRVVYNGPTGNVSLDVNVRRDDGLTFGIMNLLPPGLTLPNSTHRLPIQSTVVAHAAYSDSSYKEEFAGQYPFIFADGRPIPPDLLRDTPPQNFLGESVRVVGLSMVGTTAAFSILAAWWTCLLREHKIIKAAQPPFLYMMCFGSVVLCFAIIPLSFDESYGQDKKRQRLSNCFNCKK